MWQLVRMEQLKLHHTFGRKLPILAPALTLVLALVLTSGYNNTFPAGAWNWWYIMLLPGMLAILSYLNVKKDKKAGYYNLLSTPVPREKSWFGKIFYCAGGLLLANLLIFLGTWAGGAVFGTTISFGEGLWGAVLLALTYLWEIPLCLFLNVRFGVFTGVFTSMALAVLGVAFLADTGLWWVCPSSIPIRLMCPVLGILPNGLLVPQGSPLLLPDVILPGITLSLLWFLILAVGTARWFRKMEV